MDEAQLRKRLNERKRILTDLLAGLQGELHQTDEPLSPKFSEQPTELEEREVNEALGEEARAELRQIEHALARVDAGMFGICEDCGEEIAPARLEALPYTTRCVDCAQALEQGR